MKYLFNSSEITNEIIAKLGDGEIITTDKLKEIVEETLHQYLDERDRMIEDLTDRLSWCEANQPNFE